MSYPKVKALLEENPKTTRKEVMAAVGCGTLQAAAWMQRYKAEVECKRDGDLFTGKYKHGGKPKHIKQPKPKRRVRHKDDDDD